MVMRLTEANGRKNLRIRSDTPSGPAPPARNVFSAATRSDRPACCASSASRAFGSGVRSAVVNALLPEDAGDDHSGNYFSSNDQTPFQLVHGEVARN